MTRRELEVIIITSALVAGPVFGLIRMWSRKTLGTAKPGGFLAKVAEVAAISVG